MSDTQKALWERYDFTTLPTLANGDRMTTKARDFEFRYLCSLEGHRGENNED